MGAFGIFGISMELWLDKEDVRVGKGAIRGISIELWLERGPLCTLAKPLVGGTGLRAERQWMYE